MKIKLHLLLCLTLLGCKSQIQKSDIEIILQRIDCSGSGYIYMYDNYTIQEEINYFDSLVNKKDLSPLMKELLTVHLARTKMVQDSFQLSKSLPMKFMSMQSTRMITVYAKPPNPCPKPGSTCMYNSTSISYFATGSNDDIKVTSDGQPVQEQATHYDQTTKIKTVEFPNPITANNKIQLTRLDGQQIIVATYIEEVQQMPGPGDVQQDPNQ